MRDIHEGKVTNQMIIHQKDHYLKQYFPFNELFF
jgi:hypothetical protein